eukprot:COSAG01_NODE_35868_length_525_cov_1.640845_1_plen_134_part_10
MELEVMASPKGPLETFLVGANLSAYTDKITSLGAAEVADLKDIEDAELSGLGMTTIEIRRLRRQATNALSSPDALPAGQQNEGLAVPAVPVNVGNTGRGSMVFNSAAPQPMTMHQPQQMMQQQPMMQQPMMQQP